MYDSIEGNIFKPFLFFITYIRILLLGKQGLGLDHEADCSIGGPSDCTWCNVSVCGESSHDVGIHERVCFFSDLAIHVVIESIIKYNWRLTISRLTLSHLDEVLGQ